MEVVDKSSSSLDIQKLSHGDTSLVNSVFQNRVTAESDLWGFGADKKSSLSSLAWTKTSEVLPMMGGSSMLSLFTTMNGFSGNVGPLVATASPRTFSSSLPVMFHEKSILSNNAVQNVDVKDLHLNAEVGDEILGSLEEMESETIGNLLPDDEEQLLAGIVDRMDLLGLTNNTEESEDFDLFSSGGGLELDSDSQEGFGSYMNNHRGLDNFSGGIASHHGPPSNGPGSVIGEHPYGEHPSRTLFVRNINSNVEDSELRALFEQYGSIRTLYTACKHRGFVMISYYDIRAARSAMRALQNKPLRRRKLDIHFSIPKDNPSDKDINQGTLVVFNLDASVSNDDLRQIFGAYGEVKEIRETPHKRHHKFIEFYDVRAAEAALRALNRSDIAGKRIKLEPSRPGGARRSLMQQLSQELDQEDTYAYRPQGSPSLTNSPPAPLSGHPSLWGHVGSPVENGSVRGLHHSMGLGIPVSGVNKAIGGGVAATLPPHAASIKVGTIGSHLGRTGQSDASHSSGLGGLGIKPAPTHHSHSFPEYSNGAMPFYTPPSLVSVGGASGLHVAREVIEGTSLQRTGSGAGNDVSLFEHAPGAIGIPSSGPVTHLSAGSGGSGSLTGPQFLWGNPSPYQHSVPNSPPVIWSTTAMGHTFNPAGHTQSQSYGYSGVHGRFVNTFLPSHRHHIGSAPSGDPSFMDRHLGYFGESPDTSFLGPGSLGAVGMAGSNGAHVMNLGGGHAALNPGATLGTNGGYEGGASPNSGMMSPWRRTHMFQAGGLPIPVPGSSDGLSDRGRIRRTESNSSQSDNKKQYQLDIDSIQRGEDTRTTLMIKNIPNKYTSKMLLAAIDENHRGSYDFLYLPIDFKNKCNVGYAFINMTAPCHIISFYQAFNGKKWEKFNSEKVASLAYARIQGKAALVAHFQNSSLMNEDKRCRPILFHSEGPEAGDQEPFPSGAMRARLNKDRNGFGEFLESPTSSSCKDDFVPGSAGSNSGGTVSGSPEKEGA